MTSGVASALSDSYGDDGAEGGSCHATGEACDTRRCCNAVDASCYRTYANAFGVEAYTCQRTCIDATRNRPCKILAPCAQPWAECSDSGCCASAAQRCFEKNRTTAVCMPTCQAGLPRFRGWTCADRNGRSSEFLVASAPVLIEGADARGEGAASVLPAGAAGAVMRSVLGESLATLGVTHFGSKNFFLIFLTLAGVLGCFVLFLVVRASRAACQSTRRKIRVRRVPRPRGVRLVQPEEDEQDFVDED